MRQEAITLPAEAGGYLPPGPLTVTVTGRGALPGESAPPVGGRTPSRSYGSVST